MIFFKTIEECAENATWILMVHGFTHNYKYFGHQVDYFKSRYRILLVDLRGHGNSKNSVGPFGVEEYTDDIEEVLSTLNISEFLIWGTHTGSAISLVLALRNKYKIKAMILEGTFIPGFYMPRTAELINTAKSDARNEGIKVALCNWYENADWFEYMRKNPGKCRATEHKKLLEEFMGNPLISETEPMTPRNVAELLQNISIPCLVYNGEHDLDEFKDAANHLYNYLTIVNAEVIPEAGGFPGWENPQKVNSVVESFLCAVAC